MREKTKKVLKGIEIAVVVVAVIFFAAVICTPSDPATQTYNKVMRQQMEQAR